MPGEWPHVPGFEIVRRIAFGISGQVYEAKAPGGFSKAIKIVPVDDNNPLSQRELDGVGLIRAIRHPYLIGIDRVDINDSEITLVMELADGNLRDEFRAARSQGFAGIPRPRLLALLSEAAEVLDYLNLQHNVRHLDIKPENLFIVAGHLKVGDFGLVREAARDTFGAFSHAATPAYAGPEMFERTMASTTDQYSLAVVYVEMLSGRLPYRGVHAADLMIKQSSLPPDLGGLPFGDRQILARALSLKPDDRFPSCCDFLNALIASSSEDRRPDSVRVIVPVEDGTVAAHTTPLQARTIAEPLGDQANHAATLFVPGRTPTSTSTASLVSRDGVEAAREVFARYAEMRNAPLLEPHPFENVVYLQGGPRGWRPLLGVRDPFLLIVRFLERRSGSDGTLVVVTLEHHGNPLPKPVFEQHARVLLDDVARETRMRKATPVPLRGDPRFPFPHVIRVVPKNGGLRNISLPCSDSDISRRGMGAVSQIPIGSDRVSIVLPGNRGVFAAELVRCEQRPTSGVYDLGLRLSNSAEIPADELAHFENHDTVAPVRVG